MVRKIDCNTCVHCESRYDDDYACYAPGYKDGAVCIDGSLYKPDDIRQLYLVDADGGIAETILCGAIMVSVLAAIYLGLPLLLFWWII
jgi:hypothetical protein